MVSILVMLIFSGLDIRQDFTNADLTSGGFFALRPLAVATILTALIWPVPIFSGATIDRISFDGATINSTDFFQRQVIYDWICWSRYGFHLIVPWLLMQLFRILRIAILTMHLLKGCCSRGIGWELSPLPTPRCLVVSNCLTMGFMTAKWAHTFLAIMLRWLLIMPRFFSFPDRGEMSANISIGITYTFTNSSFENIDFVGADNIFHRLLWKNSGTTVSQPATGARQYTFSNSTFDNIGFWLYKKWKVILACQC